MQWEYAYHIYFVVLWGNSLSPWNRAGQDENIKKNEMPAVLGYANNFQDNYFQGHIKHLPGWVPSSGPGRLFKGWRTLSAECIAIQHVFLTVIRWIVIFSLDSIIHSLNTWAQIYNKGHSIGEFLFSHDNKVSQRDYNNFPSQSLYLTRYKNCPYRKAWWKKNPTQRNLKDARILTWYQNSILKTKNYKL